MMKVFAVLAAIPLLLGNQGGCTEEQVRLIIPEVPENMLHCLPDPLKGKNIKQLGKLNDKQIAIILVNYKSAHADCEAKVNEFRKLYYGWKS